MPHYLSVISIGIWFLRSICTFITDSFFLCWLYSTTCMCHSFIHSTFDDHVNPFQCLTVANAINSQCLCTFLLMPTWKCFSKIEPRRGIAGSQVMHIFSLTTTAKLPFRDLFQLILPKSVCECMSLHNLARTPVLVRLFQFSKVRLFKCFYNYGLYMSKIYSPN